jgi:amidase
MLAAIAGYDPKDETSLAVPVDNYMASLEQGVSGLRIGLDEAFIVKGSSAIVGSAIIDAIRVLEQLGARIVKVSVPDVGPGLAAWTTLCVGDTAAAHKQTYPARAAEYGPGFRSFLELGGEMRARDYAEAHMVRERFANQFQMMFDQMDLLACPSMGQTSIPATAMPESARELLNGDVEGLLRFTAPFDLSRNPTLSLPCGKSPEGPPPSLQLVGRLLGESTLLRAGRAFERATDWHLQRPPIK